MIVEFSVVDTKDFTIEHLFDSPENQDLIPSLPLSLRILPSTSVIRTRTLKRRS